MQMHVAEPQARRGVDEPGPPCLAPILLRAMRARPTHHLRPGRAMLVRHCLVLTETRACPGRHTKLSTSSTS
ncbi:hypothetical protein SBBP2_2430003 [Burkholderiales bacterium]|nr:hypothetical protein SBBP2_2430003 [Burkholderiales bacterium]